jgi:8-oxo-dGTP diphosphatase
MDPALEERYGNRVRVRVCGLLWKQGQLLMANHRGLVRGDFWAPPGGGLEIHESVEQCLKKEFMEETGLGISRGNFRFACEFRKAPLHAIELFFEVAIAEGELRKGDDPELPIIDEVRFMSPAEISRIPDANLHGIFRLVPSPEDLKTLTGFFRI